MAGKESYCFANPNEWDDEGEWDDKEMSYPRSSHRGDMYDGCPPPPPPPFYPALDPYGARSVAPFAPSQRLCDTIYSASFYVPTHGSIEASSSTTHDVQVLCRLSI